MIIQSKADEGILTPGVDLAYGIVAPGPKGVKILNTDAVLRQYGPRYVCEPNSGRLYTFDGVAYVNVGMATIQADIYARARDEGLLVITATEWATISKALTLYNLSTALKLPRDEYIPFRDGILNLGADRGHHSRILRRGDPKVFSIGRLNVRLEDMAVFDRDPTFEPAGAAYLHTMLGNSPDDERVLFECIGCFLYDRARRFNPMLYVYGSGGSGKSNLGNVMARILGERFTATKLPDSGQIFNLAFAYRDLLFIDEVRGGVLSDAALTEMKALTSAAPYSVTPKGKEAFQIQKRDKPMVFMASNDRPDFQVDTGLSRRFRTVRTADDVRMDPDSYPAWMTDDFCSWVAWKALAAYEGLLTTGNLHMNDSTQRLLISSESSELKAWMENEGVTTREQAAKWLCSLYPPYTFQSLLDSVKAFENRTGTNPERTKTNRRTLVADLDRLYGLEWDLRRRAFVRIKSNARVKHKRPETTADSTVTVSVPDGEDGADDGQPGT